jgi:hypothetical protein
MIRNEAQTYHDRDESRTGRTRVPASNLLKGDGEGKEQQVEQRVDKRQVDRHAEDNRLPEHEDERSRKRNLERLGERNPVHLVGGSVGVRVVFLSESRCLLLEQDRGVRFRCEEREEEDASEEDEEDPVDPSPAVSTDVDPTPEERSEAGAHAMIPASIWILGLLVRGTYKMVSEKTAIGIPRSLASQMSAMVPPTLVIGAEEAVPAICGASVSLEENSLPQGYLPVDRPAWFRCSVPVHSAK